MDNANELNQTETMAESTAAMGAATAATSAAATATEAETDPYVDKLTPIYHKATTACSKMMEPIHEMNAYVDKKNELDEQYKDQADSEAYKNAVKELQTGYFGEDVMKVNIANKFEKVQDFADSYGITAVGSVLGTVAGKLKDAFSQTSVGQKFEDIKLAASEIEDPTTEVTSGEKTEDTVTASAEMTGAGSGVMTGATGAVRAAQASSYLGVSEMEGSEAEASVGLES